MASKLKKIDRGVSIQVHPLFLDKIFEKERKNMQDKLGIGLSQRAFTEYLVKANARISYPKIKNTFAPKNSSRRSFGLI